MAVWLKGFHHIAWRVAVRTSDMAGKEPIDFFQLLVSDEMLNEIVTQTN